MPARCDDTLMSQQGELHDPGQVILDRYELLRVLGSGGWGRVYLANDQMLNRLVAIKQLVPRLAADSAAVSRFKREASAVASIRDPYVLTIHDIYECGAQHYMVMEYADAGTLAQRMRLEGVLSPYEAISVAIDICKGLRAIHLKGIIHRDVKPANVMFFSRPDSAPVAKLGDLGIALQQHEEERLTPSDGVVGTLIYLSPEQATSHALSPASDLYSLGAVVYEMISGELHEPVFINSLFAGTSSEALAQLGAIPEPISPLLVKALRRKPEDRFQSADEMLQALERSRGRLSASFSTQVIEHIAPATPSASQAPAKSRWLVALLAAVTITLTLVVGGVMAAFRLGAGPASPTQALVDAPSPIPAVAPISPPLPSATPTSSPTPTPTSSPEPTPSPLPSPSPTPSPVSASALPTRVRGQATLTLLFRDSSNLPDGVFTTGDDASVPIIYKEGSYLWGEIATRIGSAVFQINRSALNPKDPRQHLPSYLQLNVEYSTALIAAMQQVAATPPGFNPSTGEFWGGRFWCGSAVQAKDSPYWMAVQLLQDGRAIASRRYVIGVVDNPTCPSNPKSKNPANPPTQR